MKTQSLYFEKEQSKGMFGSSQLLRIWFIKTEVVINVPVYKNWI
jgi:hypothetical protein